MSNKIENEAIATTEAPTARIVGGPERSKAVPLTWPVEYDGKIHESITVRRLTGAEVRDLLAKAAAGNLDFLPSIDCPKAVYEALDDDDLAEVDMAVNAFMPRRLRELAGQAQASGATS